MSLHAALNRLDVAIVAFLRKWSIPVLRYSLAVVFIWFGALKWFGVSPVVGLVSAAVPWVDPKWFIPFLGAWEIVIGVGLLFRITLRVTLLLFLAQMIGTFLVLIVRPDIAFQHGNPFLLTTEGEFVIKNLVLISGGIVVGSTVRSHVKNL